MPYTLGFFDVIERDQHFDRHVTIGQEMVAADAPEYEALADDFLGRPLDGDTQENYRMKRDGTRGDKIRYNRVTQEYAILSQDNYIRSYYIANPAVHRFLTNADYFRWDCRRVK